MYAYYEFVAFVSISRAFKRKCLKIWKIKSHTLYGRKRVTFYSNGIKFDIRISKPVRLSLMERTKFWKFRCWREKIYFMELKDNKTGVKVLSRVKRSISYYI